MDSGRLCQLYHSDFHPARHIATRTAHLLPTMKADQPATRRVQCPSTTPARSNHLPSTNRDGIVTPACCQLLVRERVVPHPNAL
jgi:hypothetical protein